MLKRIRQTLNNMVLGLVGFFFWNPTKFLNKCPSIMVKPLVGYPCRTPVGPCIWPTKGVMYCWFNIVFEQNCMSTKNKISTKKWLRPDWNSPGQPRPDQTNKEGNIWKHLLRTAKLSLWLYKIVWIHEFQRSPPHQNLDSWNDLEN